MQERSSLHLYNTLTKREEEFAPLEDRLVKMYTCGPTVYGRPHIGNYASFLMADLLRRWLEVRGFEVRQVKNITDVGHLVADRDEGEDKIEKQARAEKVDPLVIARKYTEEFLADEHALNIEEPFARPKATETIKGMLAIIRTLTERGHAYETDDGVYFAVTTFPAYGKLSGNTLQNLEAGARIAVNEAKKHPADFALWKKCVGENARHALRWDSRTGERVATAGEDPASGFPGWHIECSAMARALLGEHIDIHTGGEDNIFPHHESEIAQSESSFADVGDRRPFARFWVHRRRIDIAGAPFGSAQGFQKMSKSLGNILSLPDIVAKGFSPLDIRYYLLSVHYRTNLKFTWKGLEDARKARRKIVEWVGEMNGAKDEGLWTKEGGSAEKMRHWKERFAEAMDADLNTPAALAVIFDAMAWSRNVRGWSEDGMRELRFFMDNVRRTFGCFEPEAEEIPADVRAMAEEREAARARKDFAASDRLREEIFRRGFVVKDTSEGQKVSKK